MAKNQDDATVPGTRTPEGEGPTVPVGTSPSGAGHTGAGTVVRPALVLAALGIVFGDIGTSPLYALEECFDSVHGVEATPANVLGVLSLVFWSLVMVIGLKYCNFLLKANNKGEGGIFALLGLLTPRDGGIAKTSRVVLLAAIAGSALLYADGVITPAISVLSAVEGLERISPQLERWVVPITVAILAGLFSIQRMGTSRLGGFFGPVMLCWFGSLAFFGILAILDAPLILGAANPAHAVAMAAANPWGTFAILGSVMLCITGGEALYADLGHFGRKPMVWSWYGLVMPALLINYFGQGAAILNNPHVVEHPFFAIIPDSLVLPMVVLAAAATVIASQAIISGVFSLTQQAVALGILPRIHVQHTGERGGQVFVPAANTLCGIACITLVLMFRSSENLADAYGLAVAADMTIVTILFSLYKRHTNWRTWQVGLFLSIFLTIDLAFLSAGVLKIPTGGWITILMAVSLFTLMRVWTAGRQMLSARFAKQTLSLDQLLNSLEAHPVHRVAGTAIFLTANTAGVPPTLMHHLKHLKVLHEQVAIMNIITSEVPRVADAERLKVDFIRDGFWRIVAYRGFLERLDVPRLVRLAADAGFSTSEGSTTYFLGRTIVTARGKSPMSTMSKRIFCWLDGVSGANPLYFAIPPGRMVELGIQIDL
ncbi:MAG: KUP/HAK/KT family potassium transporter [Planctomycetota bacterium]|nr:KUP/HAK/KT family potassium transporter [Planctomycetota bacterium]